MQDIKLSPDERLDKVNENITIIQKKNGLTFGTDAYLLSAFIKEQRKARGVELGAGTGIISLLLASKDRLSHITALEIQKEFASIAEKNVAINNLDNKIQILEADVRDVTPALLGGEVDVVFSNPPYMKKDSGKRNEHDIKYIARHEVCGGIEDFCLCAKRLLKHGGKFYCVWRPDRLSELLVAMSSNMLEPKKLTLVCADTDTPPSIALVCAVKGGAAGMKMTKPLFLYDSPIEKNDKDGKSKTSRQMSENAQKIYDTMSFSDFENEF